MKKRFLSVLLSLCMVLTMVPTVAFATDTTPADGNNELISTEPVTKTEEEGDSSNVERGRSEANPFTSVEEYNKAIEDNKGNDEEFYLTIKGQTFNAEGESPSYFALTNTQGRSDPPKLHLTLINCNFVGNTAKDGTNSAFMYLSNCQSLTINNCTFDAGISGLKYGINWNLCGIQGSEVSITNSTFTGTYEKNALKLNQRNGTDDAATDVKPNDDGKWVAASIASAMIENCTFSGTNAIIALGSQGKGNGGAASPSTGAFPVTISDVKTVDGTSGEKSEVDVQLAYLAAANEEAPTVKVGAEETAVKTAAGDLGTEEDFVAAIGTDKFITLESAVYNAKTGDTIDLLQNVTLDAGDVENTTGQAVLSIDKSLTINGNKHAINGSSFTDKQNLSMINITGENTEVTLKDVVIDGQKAEENAENGPRHGLNIWNAGTVTLENVTIQNNSWYAVTNNGSNLVVNNLKTSGNAWGINIDNGGTAVINNAEISETSSIVYENVGEEMNGGSLTVNSGEYQNIVVKAENEGEICSGTINLKGGTFNGVTTEGRGTAIGLNDAIVTISGGKFEYTSDSSGEDDIQYASITDLLDTGCELDKYGTVVPSEGSVASIGSKGYNSLITAVEAAENGDTIKLLTGWRG